MKEVGSGCGELRGPLQTVPCLGMEKSKGTLGAKFWTVQLSILHEMKELPRERGRHR